jgi:hypothetical protein
MHGVISGAYQPLNRIGSPETLEKQSGMRVEQTYEIKVRK